MYLTWVSFTIQHFLATAMPFNIFELFSRPDPVVMSLSPPNDMSGTVETLGNEILLVSGNWISLRGAPETQLVLLLISAKLRLAYSAIF